MKKIFTLIALFSTGILFAQEEEGDTTRFRVGGLEFIIIDHDTIPVNQADEDWDEDYDYGNNNDLTYWSGFHVGINMLMNESVQSGFSSDHLKLDPANSFSYSFNFMEHRIPIIKDYFGIVTGLGFTNSRFGFDNDRMRLASNADSTWGFVDTTLVTGFSKNQLRVNYFNIPVLFQINTSKQASNNFHITFGVIGGVRIGSKVKYVYEVFGGESENKEKGRHNLNAFAVSGTFRMGYKDFGVFANYDLLSLYEKGKSELSYPLTFGASFHF